MNVKSCWSIKITKQIYGVYVGVGIKDIVKRERFGMKQYSTIGHGLYMIGTNGVAYSHHDESINNKKMI